MIQKLKTIESTTKIIASTIAGLVAILAALISIYRGIRDLNITATKLVDTIPVVEQHSNYIRISIDYDISQADTQLAEQQKIDRILLKKLLKYKKENLLTNDQLTSVDYLERKSGPYR